MIFQAVVFSLLTQCLAVHIDRMDVPALVELGTSAVVLDCEYSGSVGPGSGLVVKWFFNGSSGLVYQWIPPMNPQGIGLLKGKVDLKYKISEDPRQRYRAVRIVNPSTDLGGNYTCVVSTFTTEDRRTRPMLVYSTGKDFQFYQEKKYVFLVTLICQAKDMYPRPHMTIISQEGKPLKKITIESKMDSWGLYSITVTALVHDDDVTMPSEEFLCSLSIPAIGYTTNRTTVYYPGLMPTAHIAAVEMEKRQEMTHFSESSCLKPIISLYIFLKCIMFCSKIWLKISL